MRAASGPLTPQLAAVLAGAASGETAKETARRLGLAKSTVDKARRQAVERLGCRTLPEATHRYRP